MNIDLFLTQELHEDELVELARVAEDYGIHGVWTYNFVADRDRFMCLGLIAKATTKLKLGPAALSPYELHPLMMANSLLTLNEFSEGRARIVVGGGGAVMTAMGIIPKRRVRAVREAIEFLKMAAGSAHQPVSYEGELFSIRNYRADWAQSEPPVIYAGANGPQSTRMGTEVADGIMMSDFTVPMTQEVASQVQDAFAARGQSAEGFRINNYFAWHVKDDREEAEKEARRNLVLRGILQKNYLSTFMTEEDCHYVAENMGPFWAAFRRQTHVIDGVPDRIIQTLVDNLTLTGTTDNLKPIIEELQAFSQAGATEISLGLHEEPMKALHVIGQQILPALR